MASLLWGLPVACLAGWSASPFGNPFGWIVFALVFVFLGLGADSIVRARMHITISDAGVRLGHLLWPARTFEWERIGKVIVEQKFRRSQGLAVCVVGDPWTKSNLALVCHEAGRLPRPYNEIAPVLEAHGVEVSWRSSWYPDDPRSHEAQPAAQPSAPPLNVSQRAEAIHDDLVRLREESTRIEHPNPQAHPER